MSDDDGVLSARLICDGSQGPADPGRQLVPGLARRKTLPELPGSPRGQCRLVNLPRAAVAAAVQVAHVDLAQVVEFRRDRQVQPAETICAVCRARRSGEHTGSP